MIELSIVTVKNSLDALATLRSANEAFELVVTDLHMPGMNGLELQKQVKEEFKIPVIIMSSDDKESVVLKSLESGAAFYMVKPVNPDDLHNVWQYAVASKKGKEVVIDQEMGSAEGVTSSIDKLIVCEDANSSSSVNEEGSQKKKRGRKRVRDHQDQKEENDPVPAKKAKVVWTNTLHNRFLQAVSHISLEKAVPKKILEFMNVPGLTRENVASHLQKYRMFLKKVAEKGFWTSRNVSERVLRSSFAYGYANSMFQNPQQEYWPFLRQQPFMRSSFQPGYGGTFCGLGSSRCGLLRFPNQEASSSNSVPQLRYGQSSLFCNPTSLQRPMFSNPYPLHLANRSTFNNTGMNLFSNAATTNGVTSGTSPMQMNPEQNQANLQNNATPFKFGTIGIDSSNYSSGASNMGTINSSYPSLNQNNNYAGIRLTSEGELIGTGLKRFSGNELSSGSNNGFNGLINWTHNNNLNNAPPGNEKFGFSGAQVAGFSSTGFGSASQFSPTFFPANPENTSVLAPMPQQTSALAPLSQQHTSTGLANTEGENDNAFHNLMNNASNFCSISDNNQQDLGEGDLGELLFGSTYATPYQEQNVEGFLNVNLPSSPYPAEVSSPVNELLNAEFSSACTIADKTPEQSSSQPQGREETVNFDFGGHVSPVRDDYYPSFEQPQCSYVEPVNSELSGIHLEEAPISGNEVWGEEYLNFLLTDE
ncbi:hypothetical protein P3X46_023750 [Hevea brasiliensis]|uniref:Response regulatory domain-containing protein n=1 Tax=Hevea brasiliensis TaxID=3981 RepID=A0ABQ9LFN8_HEVBR|nr:hypothetical protein P3X46_023750 [Hevea brasiliensis]